MRNLALIVSAIGLVGASPSTEAPIEDEDRVVAAAPIQSLDNPTFQVAPTPWSSLPAVSSPSQRDCADRIRDARENAGLPKLSRRTADPDRPELIWAVDHRRDGCGVLVAKGDPDDIRPVPELPDTIQMIPAGK